METTPKADKFKSVYGTPCTSVESTSPFESKEKRTPQQLSASLKERLKRSRRSFTSPAVTVAKRLCVDDDEEEGGQQVPSWRSFTSPVTVAKRLCVDEEEIEEDDGQQVPADSKETVNNPPQDMKNVDINKNRVRSVDESVPGPIPEPTPLPVDSLQLRHQLKREVREKMETLRRLKMVQMYRGKNDMTQLQILIAKWRSCVQDALYELQTDLPIDGRKASLSHLIDHFGLNDSLLHFDRTEDDFTT
ncbi:swi5-dependent recombination DNA repair protein 1 homolog [Diretmus argenteus]